MNNVGDKNKVSFKILDKKYNILTSSTQKEIDEFVDILEQRIEMIENTELSCLPTLSKLIFASINLASDYRDIKIENDELKKSIENPTLDLTNTKEQIEDINSILDEKNDEYKSIKNDFDELFRLSKTYEKDLKNLRGKMNLLSFELENKDLELLESNEKIKYLEGLIK